MQKDYIHLLSESYVQLNQKNIDEPLDPLDLCEHFYYALSDLREHDYESYQMISKSNKFAQEKFFKDYFNYTFYEDDLKFFENATDDQLAELYNIILETPIVLTEDMDSMKKFLSNMISKVARIFGSHTKSSAIPSFVIQGIVLWLLAIIFRKPVSQVLAKIVYHICRALVAIGRYLVSAGTQIKLGYQVIMKNTEECYSTCEFDPRQASFSHLTFHYGAQNLHDLSNFFLTEKGHDAIHCLRQCYLHHIKEMTKLSVGLYFNCLKSTGSLSKLQPERDFSIFLNLIVQAKFENTCNKMQVECVRALELFRDVIRLLFPLRSEQNLQYLDLMKDIYQLQKDATQSQSQYHYKPKQIPLQQVKQKRSKQQYYKPSAN
jgi:hypothetical protein